MILGKVSRALLFSSGLLAVGFGAALLFYPAAMHALNGVNLGGNASLLSEIRAPGGMLCASGVLIAAGAFSRRLSFTSAILTTLAYSAYGLSRVLSIVLDGAPATPLWRAMAAELVLGALGAFILWSAPREAA